MNAAWESFHRAACELASSAPIKQRLMSAFSKHLKDIDVAQLPSDLQSGYLELSESLTRVSPLRGETAIWATVRKMSNEEAGLCAQRIVELLGVLATHQEQQARPRPKRMLSLYSAEA